MLLINKNTSMNTIIESKEAVIVVEAGACPDQIQNLSLDAKLVVLSNESPTDAIQALPSHIKRVDLNTNKYQLAAGHITLTQAIAIPTHISSAAGEHNLDILRALLSKGIKIEADSPKKQTLQEELALENQNQKILIAQLQAELQRLRSSSNQHEEVKLDSPQHYRIFKPASGDKKPQSASTQRIVRIHLGPHEDDSEIAQLFRKK